MTSSSNVRVRFAPSPTGFLHIGGARTALFNWLYARAMGGKYLLRIEDTDRQRSEERFTVDIMESLRWLGMEWDEEPIYQSKRFDRYKDVAEDLLKRGLAYKCDCTPEILDAARALAEKEKRPFRYPGTCKNKKSVGANHVLRIVTPNEGETGFTDLIRGPISFQNKDIDDWVIFRGDGSPTYNFSVVIDDHDQGVTHVLRGDDHINNTPKQILLYQALGYPVPNFAHLPMILGADRTKLSKRHGAASTIEYRNMGYLPEVVINFIVRLGWSHGDQEIFTVEELKKFFSLDHIGKANAIFNVDKLNWISGQYMRDTKPSVLLGYLKKFFSDKLIFEQKVSDERLEKAIAIIQGKVKNILELIDQIHVLFGPDPVHDISKLKDEDRTKYRKILTDLAPVLAQSSFSKEDIDKRVREEATRIGEKLTPLAQALRFAMTGGSVSPGIFEMLEVQGKEIVMRRLEKTLGAFRH